MALDFRKGAAAIAEAQENKGGGNFQRFAPSIRWTEDKEEKYVLFLTPVEEIPLVDLHEYVPIGKGEKSDGESYQKYGFYISRKDQAIGEDYDLLEDKHEWKPKQRNVAVAVELEPKFKSVNGRKRPDGFEVKTREFERRIDPEDENSAKETVEAPVLGIVIQSPYNFFGYLGSFNESEGPIEETPFKIVRRGKDKNTQFDYTPWFDQEVDLGALIENVDNITYLNDSMDELVAAIDGLEEDEASRLVAAYLLDARLDELADGERYQEEVGPLEEVKGKNAHWNKKSDKTDKKRPARKSQRDKVDDEDVGEEDKEADEKPSRQDRYKRLKNKAEKRRDEAAA